LLGKEALQAALHRVFVQCLPVALFESGGKEHAPESLSVIAGDLEQRTPFLRVGEIVARALRILGIEGEWSGQNQETFGMGVAFELDPQRLAHRRASAVGADEVASGHGTGSAGTLDQDLDSIVEP